MTGRKRPEWRGKTPDARIPNAVRARVWLRCEGRCALTGLKIDKARCGACGARAGVRVLKRELTPGGTPRWNVERVRGRVRG